MGSETIVPDEECEEDGLLMRGDALAAPAYRYSIPIKVCTIIVTYLFNNF